MFRYKKNLLFIFILLLTSVSILLPQNITFEIPAIIKGYVVNETHFYGDISIGTQYSDGMPLLGMDRKAYYSIDAGENWDPVQSFTETGKSYEFSHNAEAGYSTAARFSDGRLIAVHYIKEDTVYKVYYTVYNEDGTPGGKVHVADTTVGNQVLIAQMPRVCILKRDNFVIMWPDYDTGNTKYILRKKTYYHDDEGIIQEKEISLDTEKYTKVNENNLFYDIKAFDKGYIVVWCQVYSGDTYLKAQLFDIEGTYVSEVSGIANYEGEYSINNPEVDIKDESKILISWKNNQTLYSGIYSFDNISIVKQIGPVTVSGDAYQYNAVLLSDAGYVVCYKSFINNLSQLFVKKFDESSVLIGEAVQVTDYNDSSQFVYPALSLSHPAIFTLENNRFIAGWLNYDADNNKYSVIIKEYSDLMEIMQQREILSFSDDVYNMSFYETASGSFILTWQDTSAPANTVKTSAKLFTGLKELSMENIMIAQDISIMFKVVDENTGEEWLSPVRNYKLSNADDGKTGSITYFDGYYNEPSVQIEIKLPEGNYQALQVFKRKALLENGTVAFEYSEWTAHEEQEPSSQIINILLDDGYCYQFKAEVMNYAGITYQYISSNTIMSDRTAPVINVTDRTLQEADLTLTFDIIETASGIDSKTYRLNNHSPGVIDKDEYIFTLDNGNNLITLEAVDRAGNKTVSYVFQNVEIIMPEITILGLVPGMEYGGDIEFQYMSNVPLDNVRLLMDSQDAGSIQNGNASIDLSMYTKGSHTITISGTTNKGEEVSKSVNIIIKRNTINLLLLSPQSIEYDVNDITIDYWCSSNVNNIWYTLNGGSAQTDLKLTDLDDGDYELTLYAESMFGSIYSVSTSFSIVQKIPVLDIESPFDGQVIGENEVTVLFNTNSDVSYKLGETAGEIKPGDRLTFERDGTYEITFYAVHPLSDNEIQKTCAFTVDTVQPELELLMPQPGMYTQKDINIDYKGNKIFKNITFTLDGTPVSKLTDLDYGEHMLEITAEDQSGRKITDNVTFNIVKLDILSPEEGDRIISDAIPHIFPFKYDADSSIQTVTKAIDNEDNQLVSEPAMVDIPLETTEGTHELKVTGFINNNNVSKRVNFQIGRKNIAADAGSINYTYTRIGNTDEYDVDVMLHVRNTGALDIKETFAVRFDHIAYTGDVYTEYFIVNGLAVDDKAEFDVTGITAKFGDIFLITIDPDQYLISEHTVDNVHKLIFQTGSITEVTALLSDKNIFLQDVSVFNMMNVKTAGPVARVEFHTNSKIFIDDTPEYGFNSIVDMGLLSTEDNYVHIRAVGENGVVLDSVNYYFNLKKIVEKYGKLKFPWAYFADETDPDYKRITMGNIDLEEITMQQSRVIREGLASPPVSIPVLGEGNKLSYKIFTISCENSMAEDLFAEIDLNGAPVLGNTYQIPDGRAYVQVNTLDTMNEVVTADGVIPILDGGFKYVDLLDKAWKSAVRDIEKSVNENLTIEEMVAEVMGELSEQTDAFFNFNNFFYLSKNNMFFMGFINYSINDTVHIKTSGLNIHTEFKPEVSQLTMNSINAKDIFDFKAKASFSMNIDTDISIHTHRNSINIYGMFGLSFMNIPIMNIMGIPTVFTVDTGITLDPLHLYIPIHLGLYADLMLSDGVLSVGPAHANFNISCKRHQRLGKADLTLYYSGLSFLGVGGEIKAYLTINALCKADLIASVNPSFYPNPTIYKYAYGYFELDAYYREKIEINILGIKISHYWEWKHLSSSVSENAAGQNYTPQEVQDTIEDGRYELNLFDLIK